MGETRFSLFAGLSFFAVFFFFILAGLALGRIPEVFYSGELSDETKQCAAQIADTQRFFHWELEFPDVFNDHTHGFDAILGNPPWDVSKPNSKEFFSTVDLLYTTYGKQKALDAQKKYFEKDEKTEHAWLMENARFKAFSNWVKAVAFPFGEGLNQNGGREISLRRDAHEKWEAVRAGTVAYADRERPFRYQGGGDINLYKTFLELDYTLLRPGGGMGIIVPSNIYSDSGSGRLRDLFINRSQWEWIFGFENRQKIFNIHRSFKFNPIIIRKGGQTESVKTAFMRRNLADWENGESFVSLYPRERIEQFSPISHVLLEVQSEKDIEIVAKIYRNSVLFGDTSPDGWGIKYSTEFHMTNDSKLFPTLTQWQTWGYRPDEYSRWIKGDWQEIGSLWAELGVKPLAEGQGRCAQPPYDRLPIPRAEIPEGIILSRDARHWIRETDIPEVVFTEANGKAIEIKTGPRRNDPKEKITGPAIALPLYEGRMIGTFDFSEKGWVSGKGRTAEWREIPWEEKQIEPQYLMGAAVQNTKRPLRAGDYGGLKLGFMEITSSTNSRTFISGHIFGAACNHKVPTLIPTNHDHIPAIVSLLDSFAFDGAMRHRLVGLSMSWFVVQESPFPANTLGLISTFSPPAFRINLGNVIFSTVWHAAKSKGSIPELSWRQQWAISRHERARVMAICHALSFAAFGLDTDAVSWIMRDCDHPEVPRENSFDPKGFWRVDKELRPEHRQTVLAQVAFADLRGKIESHSGDVDKGIADFCSQNNGDGWLLPEKLTLADYGLGHDDRARSPQPVQAFFGERFLPWQTAQSAEESWKECRLHARNLLGSAGFENFLAEREACAAAEENAPAPASVAKKPGKGKAERPEQGKLF